MGKGVYLNENTYKKMSQNGLVEWQVEHEGRLHCYTAEHDILTYQLQEDEKAVHYARMKILGEPYKTIKAHHKDHKRLPNPPGHKEFMRAWKKQVKYKFNRSGWLRR